MDGEDVLDGEGVAHLRDVHKQLMDRLQGGARPAFQAATGSTTRSCTATTVLRAYIAFEALEPSSSCAGCCGCDSRLVRNLHFVQVIQQYIVTMTVHVMVQVKFGGDGDVGRP